MIYRRKETEVIGFSDTAIRFSAHHLKAFTEARINPILAECARLGPIESPQGIQLAKVQRIRSNFTVCNPTIVLLLSKQIYSALAKYDISLTDETLVRLLCENDTDAMGLLYDRYARHLYGLILQLVRETPVAEEILQDAMLKIWKNCHQYDPAKGKLLTWCLKIARNAAIDRLRLKKLSITPAPVEEMANQMPIKSINPETIGVKDLLGKLTPDLRVVIDLLYFQGYTQSEAAEKLNIPLGTLKTRCYAAINELGTLFN